MQQARLRGSWADWVGLVAWNQPVICLIKSADQQGLDQVLHNQIFSLPDLIKCCPPPSVPCPCCPAGDSRQRRGRGAVGGAVVGG